MQPCLILAAMKYPQLTVRLDDDTMRRLEAISVVEGRSRGALVKRAIRSHYGIEPPGQALAAALAAALAQNEGRSAPQVNGQGADG
jgi:predicted transcriptional regulator